MEYDDRWKRHQDRWERRQERWARKQERWARKQQMWATGQHPWRRQNAAHGVIFSVAIIALGAFFLMDNLGILSFHDVARYWPVILIALGVVRLVDSHGTASVVWGAIVAGVGSLLLLNNLGFIIFDWRVIWPAILIGIGILMLLRHTEWAPQGAGPDPSAVPPDQAGRLNLYAMFGGGDHTIDVQNFRGGQVSVMFGGYEIDLRRAAMAETPVTIDISAMFGGVEIQIPETWLAEVKGTGLFGAFVDDTRPPSAGQAPAPPKLIVTGYAMFGGVTITN